MGNIGGHNNNLSSTKERKASASNALGQSVGR